MSKYGCALLLLKLGDRGEEACLPTVPGVLLPTYRTRRVLHSHEYEYTVPEDTNANRKVPPYRNSVQYFTSTQVAGTVQYGDTAHDMILKIEN